MYATTTNGKFISLRGTPHTEACNNLYNDLFSAPTCEALAQLKLSDRTFIMNRKVRQKVQGEPNDGAMDPERMLRVNQLSTAAGLPQPYPYLKEPPPNPDAKHLFGFQGPSLASTGLDMSAEEQDELLNLLNNRQQSDVELLDALSLGKHCDGLMHAVVVGRAFDATRVTIYPC
jgi:hypothetical protein